MSAIEPLISCIIIFFNPDRQFLIKAIESVFAQTHSHWELILVDDGSTNIGTDIARDYAQKYPDRVRYLEHDCHQNLGMSAARNLGIAHARGEYIAFLDADDTWLDETLTEQVAILDTNPDAAMVYGPIQWWYSWSENFDGNSERDFIDTPRLFLDNPDRYLDRIVSPPTLLLLLLKRQISISGMLVKRQVIREVGGFENAFRGLYEDQVFCAKICLQFPTFVASKCWYRYRQHPDSCCNSAAQIDREYWQFQRPIFLQWLKCYLIERGFKYSPAWQLICWELWSNRYPVVGERWQWFQALWSRITSKLRRVLRG